MAGYPGVVQELCSRRSVMRVTTVLVVLAVFLPGFGRADDRTKGDAKALEGTWVHVSSESEGKLAPEEIVKKRDARLIIRGEKFSITSTGQEEAKGTLKLDATQEP
jgi:hypothetical protein